MNQLILDYFRRWMWVLALCAALEFGLGCWIASLPDFPFEFLGLLLAVWTGANLLSFDLRRGVMRVVAVLPLTARQIGRGWWLATVALPAIALAALLFLGAGTFHHFHPNKVFPANRLGMASLFNLPWLGTMFIGILSTLGFSEKGWERARASFFSMLAAITLFGGMLICPNASKNPFKCAMLLGVGAVLVVEGWFRAERLVPGRAGFRLTALQYNNPRGQHRAPGGCGGIPFLISNNFVRIFLCLAAMVALMALIWQWKGRVMSRQADIGMFVMMGSFMSGWFIVFYQIMQVRRQLRFLRTLPISAGILAALMIALATLPLVAVGALAAGVSGLCLGSSAVITVLKSYAFMLAPVSLCVYLAVWRGAGTQTYALMFLTLFGFYLVPLGWQTIFHHPLISHGQTGPFLALCVLLAFLLTRRALRHGSHAYLVQASPLGNLPWR